MNKKGFTLMELLVVIVIVAVVSVGATISFGTVDDNTAIKERINQFKEIQRSANLYLDLNDQATINQFISDGSIARLDPVCDIMFDDQVIEKLEELVGSGNTEIIRED